MLQFQSEYYIKLVILHAKDLHKAPMNNLLIVGLCQQNEKIQSGV